MVVVSSSLLVTSTNLAKSNDSDGFLSGYFENGSKKDEAFKTNSQENRKDNLAFVPLAKAPTAVNPDLKNNEDQDLSLVGGQALTANFGSPLKDPEENGGVKIYEVKPGDTVSGIASANGITVNTILWANDIDNVDSIMPGDKIFILPVAGLSYTIKSGDTIDSIAEKYKSEKQKIISFNNLPADGQLKEGEEIIIPDGQKEVPQSTSTSTESGISRRQYATSTGGTPTISGFRKLEGKAGTGHRFPYGYCTWYVAQRRYVPWGGNAGTWLYHAKSAGYQTGKTPRVGAIMVSSESWWGHVAIVESVSGGSFTVSEMNYKGWAKKSRRTISTSNRVIKGFIY